MPRITLEGTLSVAWYAAIAGFAWSFGCWAFGAILAALN